MNEKEIKKYLIENKTRGTAFAFMPDEVKEWCLDFTNWRSLHRFVEVGAWVNPIWKSCAEDRFSCFVNRREIVCLIEE